MTAFPLSGRLTAQLLAVHYCISVASCATLALRGRAGSDRGRDARCSMCLTTRQTGGSNALKATSPTKRAVERIRRTIRSAGFKRTAPGNARIYRTHGIEFVVADQRVITVYRAATRPELVAEGR